MSERSSTLDLAEQTRRIREASPLLDLLTAEGHTPRRSGTAGQWTLCCPLHREKSASFTVFPDGGFKCFGCGVAGRDALDYIQARDGVDFLTAKRTLAARAGIVLNEPKGDSQHRPTPVVRPTASPKPVTPVAPALTLPADAHRPDEEECLAIAHSRRLNPEAVTLASCWGLLLVGTVCKQACWILTDQSGHVAEARRMDGKPFPAFGDLGERKAHTLKGSVKSWPCGLMPNEGILEGAGALLLVEGGPDLLAALHFCLAQERWDLWPVAMLGAGAGSFHPEALPRLSGRRVRLYPHADDTGGVAVKRWAAQLQALGCTVDAFTCAGIPRCDGKPCKDLNDLALVDDDVAASYLEEVLP